MTFTATGKLLVSDLLVLAASVFALAYFWDHGAFANFAAKGMSSHSCLPLLALGLLAVQPLVPKPKTKETTPAATPTRAEAKLMYVSTAVVDYLVVGLLFYVLNRLLATHHPGDKLCPFSAACHVFTITLPLSLKDDIMCKGVWRRFVSRAKINAWPHSWSLSLNHAMLSALTSTAVCTFVLSGLAEFPSITSPAAMLRVWTEFIVFLALADMLSLHVLHRWMHEKKDWYFLHKTHHQHREDTTMSNEMDMVNYVSDNFLGYFLLLGLKWLFGFDPKFHVLTFYLAMALGLQLHSMNPYSVVVFNPFLDHLSRLTMRHSLHHVVPKSRYGHFVNLLREGGHGWTPEGRKAGIRAYNKYMKTNFPEDL